MQDSATIAGVPARIMAPRLLFLLCLAAIVSFGLLMVYSASSVEAQKQTGDALYYFVRQAQFAVLGALFIAALSKLGGVWQKIFSSNIVWLPWAIFLAATCAVFLVGTASRGATRWIEIAGVSLQPSEFLKPTILMVVAKLIGDYYEARTITTREFLKKLMLCLVPSLIFIMIQPDLGTSMIIAVTVFGMFIIAGLSTRFIAMACGFVASAFTLAVVSAPYRLVRFAVALNPWSDPYGKGYQATLAIMAFASGGWIGRGLGNSTMKYSYLPEAHNDYILAIIGEEFGFIGTVIFFLIFAVMIWSAFSIARQARTMQGRLLADGAAICLMFQFLVNALGVLSLIPMTGKTMPFISYGGSSMLASLVLAGLILRVSLDSSAPDVHRSARSQLAVMRQDETSAHLGRSTAGEVRRRSATPRQERSQRFSVLDGGPPAQENPRTRPRPGSSRLPDRDVGYGRVDLQNRADRLRPQRPTPQRRDRSTSTRRDRYDR